jgi:hypothetical protein
MIYKLKIAFPFILLISFFSITCSNKQEERLPFKKEVEMKAENSLLLKYKSSLFCIPSPHQASILIKENGIGYDPGIIASPHHAKKFVTAFRQALGLGIYGTDLGYLNIYEQVPDALEYFKVMVNLSKELDIYTAIGPGWMEKIEKNLGNQDSLLFIISDMYRNASSYLKDDLRPGTGELIIAGGWLESMYILTQVYHSSQSYQIRNLIGNQKQILNNLIDLLSPYYYLSGQYSELIDQLVDLANEFESIIYNYTYEKPEIDTIQHLTVINSESRIIISDHHLSMITRKLSDIRSQIIGI